jgi:hypothetical protein
MQISDQPWPKADGLLWIRISKKADEPTFDLKPKLTLQRRGRGPQGGDQAANS